MVPYDRFGLGGPLGQQFAQGDLFIEIVKSSSYKRLVLCRSSTTYTGEWPTNSFLLVAVRGGGGSELTDFGLLLAGVRSLRDNMEAFLGIVACFLCIVGVLREAFFGCREVYTLVKRRVSRVQEGGGLAEEMEIGMVRKSYICL